MGGTVSHCSGKKSKKKRNKKKLSDDINNHNGAVERLRTKASRLTPKISQHDKGLVEERIRASEKKHEDLQSRADKAHKQQDLLSGTLDDIKTEVDKYLQWLTEKESKMAEEIPLGYSVKDAETRLQEHNAICRELEVKQATVEIVKEKVAGMVEDLPREEKESVEKWLTELSDRHALVRQQAEDKRRLLAASVSQREVFHTSLEKIYQWLQGKEREAEKLQTLRLSSHDVEKQLEKCKALQHEVTQYKPQIEEITKRGQMLHVDCTPEEKAEIDHKVSDVLARYDALANGLTGQNHHMRDCISARKVFETDIQKNDKWCKDTEIKCATEPCLDCAVEVLEDQLKHYKVLANTSHMFHSLVKTMNETGQSFKPHLYETDTPKLQQQLKSTTEKYERVDALIKQRIAALEGALSSRSQVAESISEAKDLLSAVQEDLRRISKSLGPEVLEAEEALQQYEAVGEKLSTYQPALTQLNQAVERLRQTGQNTEADEILRVTSQFELLQDQVDQQSKKCQQGVLLRQQYQDQKAELQTLVRECEDEMNTVSELGLTIPVRIEKLEALSQKLQNAAPMSENLSKTAQVLCMDSSGEDAKAVTEEIQNLQSDLNQLKKTGERKTKQCEAIQKNREEFEATIDEAISWLEQKENVLAHCGTQDLDADKVDGALQKHNTLAREALEKLDLLKDKAQLVRAHYEKLEEPLPLSLAEKLDQIHTLEESIKSAIQKKEDYLSEAKTDRLQLENSMKQIKDWLSGAEDMLQESGYDTLDYDTLNDTLSELKDYFDEASMCQDEMEQVMELSERLMPTLDPNDKETLRQSLNNTNQKLGTVVTNFNRKQQLMEHKATDWKDYQQTVYEVAEQLQALDEQWAQIEHVPVVNQEALAKQLAETKNFQAKVEEIRPAVLELNDKSRDLEKYGSEASRALIEKWAEKINDRMTEMASTAENKHLALQDVGNQWEEYATLVQGVESMLQRVEESIPEVELEKASAHELASQLSDTRQLSSALEVSEPKITSMKKCAQTLLRNLPTAEAKVQTQEKLMAVLEKLERTQEKVKEQHTALQEELEDREVFSKEMNQIVTGLANAKQELENLGPGKEVADVMDKIEKQKVLEQEVAIQVEQAKQLSQLQATKYASLSKELPQELQLQIATVQDQASEVSELMKGKGAELQHIKVDREELTGALKDVQSWLGNAEMRLQERVVNIPDSQLRHKQLLAEFDDYKPILDKLRAKGGDLIRHTPDSLEKQRVQRLIADTNRQWLALQAKSVDRSKKLNEAEALQAKFNETAEALARWAGGAEAVVASDPERTDFSKVKEQLKQHRRLAKDVDQQQGKVAHLNELVKRMDHTVDASQARDKLAQLNQRMFKIQSDVSSRLNTLEETNDQIEDYEQELRDLRKWMDDTRANLTMKESSVNLKDQLAFHEKLLEDIENRKGKALLVAEKQTELQRTGKHPTQAKPASKLATEITELQQLAREQCETLRESVVQQQQYEAEIKELTEAISEAQERLLTSPVEASDVGSLKKQIEEHNALAMKIKTYQARVNDINDKSRELSRKAARLGPAMSDKLADLGFYPATLSSLRLPVHSDSERSALDSGVFASPRSSLNTTQQTISDDLITTSTLPSSRTQTWRSTPNVSGLSPRSLRSAKSTDTAHGLSASDIFDQSRPSGSRDLNINLNWSHPSDKLSDALNKRDETDGSEKAGSMPSVRFTPHYRSRSPSPTALVDERPMPRQYHPPQMQSLSPRTRGTRPSHTSTSKTTPLKALQTFDPLMEASTSVPNLLTANLLELPGDRQRSASFGSKGGPSKPRPLGQSDPRLAHLNASWNTLQQQLGAKEQELQLALQRQERYQQSVQDVTSRMERVHSRLSRGFPPGPANLDQQLKEYKETLQDIDGIREDIARVRERGRQVVESTDPEGYRAMQATLAMLSDRVESLQAMADDKGRQLQKAVRDKERHDIALTAYKRQVKELEDWLEEQTIRQATTPLPSDSVAELRQSLQENQSLQDEINKRLQTVSDLAVQCDALCEAETPRNADKLRNQLTNLQTNMGNLKLAAIEKQAPLKAAIKESEKRQREMDDYETSVKKLQNWVTETKQMTMAPPSVESLIIPDNHMNLQQGLKSDLSDHRQLIRQLSSGAAGRDLRPQRHIMEELAPINEEDLKQRWETLSREMALRKHNLEDMLRNRDLVDSGPSHRGWLPSGEVSGQLKDVRSRLQELNDLWQQLQAQVEDKQVRLDQALEFQQKYQDALQNISSWLDMAEQKLFNPEGDKDSQDMVRENEALQREIRSLQSEIAAMGRSSQDLLASASMDSQELIRHSLANLNDRVRLLESQAQEQGDKLRQADRQLKQYRSEVEAVQAKLREIKMSLSAPNPSVPLDQLIVNVQKLDAQLKKCEGQIEELNKTADELSDVVPQMITTGEVNSLRNTATDLKQKIMDRKADLLQSVSVKEQYEKMLQDYAEFLETASEKLKVESISVRDLDHLKQQLAAHKDFFSDLEVHRAMLDNLAAQTNQATRQKHIGQHTRLNNLTYVILDKASLHGQRLDRLVRQWNELADRHRQLQSFLDDIERQIPRPVGSDEAVVTIQEKISTYRRLQRELNEERPILFQVVDKGKQLLHSLNCPILETEVTELADRFVDLNSGISQELKRSETLGDQLSSFEAEATVLMTWLSTAKAKLSGIKHLSDQDQQSIATIRSKVDKLLEFRKELDEQTVLKNKLTATGRQLAQNKNYNTSGIQDRMGWVEQQWSLLQHDVDQAQDELHQAQMELMPSRQALNELGTWLDIMEIAVRDEKAKPVKNLADVDVVLKKFKDFKIELQSKQLTVDFVNQSVLQAPDPEVIPPVSSDQTDFAERLGHLNKRWQGLDHDVKQTLKSLETLHNKWQEYERALARVQEWFIEQEDKVARYHLIGHEVSVKQTIRDCKALQEALKSKEEEIDSVRKLGERLVDLSYSSPTCQESIQASLDRLNTQWRHLAQKVQELQNVLDDFLTQWNSYHAELQNTNQILSEVEYCLSRYDKVGADISTLTMQVDKLKNLNDEVQRGTAGFERFVKLGSQLNQVCEAPVRQEIQNTLTDVQARWRRMCAELKDRYRKFEECHQQWQQYEEECSKAKLWLENKEQHFQELSAYKDDNRRREECLKQSQALMRELDNFQSTLSRLYQLSDAVTRNMDTSSIVTITSRQNSLEQRLLTLRQSLAKQIQTLQGDLSQKQRFRDLYSAVTIFLTNAERTLGDDEVNKSTDIQTLRNRYEELKNLTVQFTNQMMQLDALNDLGYRMALSEETSKDLRDLNHKWNDLYAETKERNKTLQGLLLVQQDFSEKCDTWMTFLAQTEHDLATEIAGNLPDLQRQLRQCEKFESDMYSKQQILHAIISDGQKMMKDGEVENKEEFQQKLHLLAEQWQSVVRRANQRKAIIENSIKQWQTFNEQAERLKEWLTEKEYSLETFNVDSLPLQGIKNLIERGKHLQEEIKSQEDKFKRLHEQSKPLLQKSDDEAKEEVKVKVGQLQHQSHRIVGQLQGHVTRLDGVLRQWQECEEEIEDILVWLKDTRKTLTSDLPTSYDLLQTELNKCKDIEAAFASSEGKRQNLLAKEKKLGQILQPEDLNVLHQRIRLLNKQWDELHNQASQRAQRIHDNMFRWSNFGDRIREFHEWMDDMERKVLSSREYHIEDLLAKIQREYNEEMNKKEVTKNELMEQGRRLMRVSSEVRANDIETKLQRAEDKWNHLKSVIGFRQRKLQETLLAVQQLDVSMANLRKWLASMEHDLSGPVVYMECDWAEIQEKLQRQQELQKDIEHHSAGVGSVLNLCEVLLHDSDACPTEVEHNALQLAMTNLDKRWRNICQQSPARRSRIEETWELWQNLAKDCKDFEDWLKEVEQDLLDSVTEQLNSSFTKEEVLHFESLQREVLEHLKDLENINLQYRKLAREGRTDHSGVLKNRMTDCNTRWDKLQQQVSTMMQRLKESASMKEDYVNNKDMLYKWLTEMDVQITNIEHLSSMDIPTKLVEMKRIQDEIESRQRKIDQLNSTGLFLIQKGDAQDAFRLQKELEEFKNYHRQVLERVQKYIMKLKRNSDGQVEDLARYERQTEPPSTALADWDMQDLEAYLESSPPVSPPEKRRAAGQGVLERRSVSPVRSSTPGYSRTPDRSPSRVSRSSLRSISPVAAPSPARSLSPARSVRSRSPGRSPSRYANRSPRMSRSPVRPMTPEITREERWRKLRAEMASRLTDKKVEELLEQLVDALEDAKYKLRQVETELRSHTPTGSGLERSSDNYTRYMDECSRSVDRVRQLDRLIKTETGLNHISSVDAEVKNVLQRWEMVQAQVVEKDFRLSLHRHDSAQFHADINSMLSWLDQAEKMQRARTALPGDITQLDTIIRHHKGGGISPFEVEEFLEQLEARKTRVQSINLISKDFIDLRTEDGRDLRDKLQQMNRRWDLICSRASELQRELQEALMRCQEFHHTIHDLLLWLEGIESKVQQCEPINLASDESALWSKHRKLCELRTDLDSNRDRVMALKDTADQLLLNTDSTEMVNAKDKMHIIANRLRALHRLCSSYITSLEERLEVKSRLSPATLSPDVRDGGSHSTARASSPRYSTFRPNTSLRMRTRSPFAVSRQPLFGSTNPMQRHGIHDDNSTALPDEVQRRRPRYLSRVFRTALPLQLLLLLLLGVASLVPVCEDEYSCVLMNNFRRSLGPMLQYRDGPPPV